MRRWLVVAVCLLGMSAMESPAWAQEPYNLTAPVTNLSTMFTAGRFVGLARWRTAG